MQWEGATLWSKALEDLYCQPILRRVGRYSWRVRQTRQLLLRQPRRLSRDSGRMVVLDCCLIA